MDDEQIAKLIRETLREYTAQKEASSFPYGRVNDMSDRVPGLASLKEVLELIPQGEKQCFIEACRRCPELVRVESEPAHFLQRESFNVWAAARRLVKYWDERSSILGDRAFLPLNLSGEGALGPREVAAIKSGFQAVLPADGMGRPVLLFDFSKVDPFMDENVLARSMFFMHCVISQSEVGQKEGYTGLTVYDQSFVSVQAAVRRVARFVEEACPVSPGSIYVKQLEKKTFFEMIRSLDPDTQGISKNLNMVVAETPEELCTKMQKHHLKSNGLPVSFGGSWNQEESFKEWFQKHSSQKPQESYTESGILSPSLSDPNSPQVDLVCTKNASLEQAELDLYEAIDLLPDDQKSAYLEAMELCPDLVTRESNPKMFLRCEANDPTSAARRLVQYWDLRRDLYQERAFLPMDATGKGTLTKDEVGRLDRGFLRILPSDLQGRQVLWWDRTKMTAVRSFEEALRWWFYMFSIMAEESVSQGKGVMFIAAYNPEVYKTPIRQSSKNTITQMVTKAIPFAQMEIHVVALRPEGTELDPKLFSLFLERVGRDAITDIAPTKEEIACKLAEAGLTVAGIPDEFGGSWGRQADTTWRTQRDLVENGRYLASACDPRSPSRFFGDKKPKPVIASGSGAEETVLKSIQALSGRDIAEYREVARLDPNLVALETEFARYLVADKGDASSAAHKIVRYWKTKKELCGNKFIVPLNASDQSAIHPMETTCLGDGSMVRLISADPSGQDSLYLEDLCIQSVGWQKGMFFALRTISSTLSSKEGTFSVFIRATKPDLYAVCVKGLIELAETVFPLRVAQIHLLFQEKAPHAGQGQVHPGWVLDLKNEVKDGLSNRTMFHLSSDEDDTMESLVRMGFSRQALGAVLGSKKQMIDPLELWSRAPSKHNTKCARPTKPDNRKMPAVVHPESAFQSDNSVKELEEAIVALPDEEKSAYLKAKNEAAAVVESDSNPIWFLKYEKYNVWKAAKRLACYWNKRCEIFKDRAFLPLNQTGEGTLAKKDVAVMSTGYIAFLPNDEDGRTVICCDTARLSKKDPTTRLRNMFYWNHVSLQNELSPEKGVVVLVNLHKVSIDNRVKDVVSLCENAFPVLVHSVHVVPKVKKRSFVEDAVPQVLKLFAHTVDNNKHVHICSDKSEVMKRLQQHGLTKEGVPENLGGSWSYERFAIWQEYRIRIEWDLPLGTLDETGDSNAKPMSELTEEERVERKRRYNILHSRRKRRRDRVETEVLQKQVEELHEEHEDLTVERERLETLLVQANRLVSRVESSQTKVSNPNSTQLQQNFHTTQGGGDGGASAGIMGSFDTPSFDAKSSSRTQVSGQDVSTGFNCTPQTPQTTNAGISGMGCAPSLLEANQTMGAASVPGVDQGFGASSAAHESPHGLNQNIGQRLPIQDSGFNQELKQPPIQGVPQGFGGLPSMLQESGSNNTGFGLSGIQDLSGFGRSSNLQDPNQGFRANPSLQEGFGCSTLQDPLQGLVTGSTFPQHAAHRSLQNNNMGNNSASMNFGNPSSLQEATPGFGDLPSSSRPGTISDPNVCFGGPAADDSRFSTAQLQQLLFNNGQSGGLPSNLTQGLGLNEGQQADQLAMNPILFQSQLQQQQQQQQGGVDSQHIANQFFPFSHR